MSRTIRRIKEKNSNKSGRSHFLKDYVVQSAEVWHGSKSEVTCCGGTPYQTLTGKEYSKAYHNFHGDSKASKVWSNPHYSKTLSHIKNRMHYKQEISRFVKNNEHDILNKELYCLSYDRF